MDFNPGQFWTTARCDALTKGVAEAEPFGVIGDRLGCTRNQAAAQAMRMGLQPPRVAPPPMTARGARKTVRRVGVKTPRKSRAKTAATQEVVKRVAPDRVKPRSAPAPAPAPKRLVILGAPGRQSVFMGKADKAMPKGLRDVGAQGVPARIMDDGFGGCRWPINDPGPGRGHEMLFCCAKRVDQRYCAVHADLAGGGKPERKPRATPPERRFL